jgi:protein-tyrosine phosphatase
MWCDPVVPHLHDPHTLSSGYFDTNFRRVDQAVRRLAASLPHLKNTASVANPVRERAV